MNNKEITDYIINNNYIKSTCPRYLYFHGNIQTNNNEHYKLDKTLLNHYNTIFLFDMIYDINFDINEMIYFNGAEITINGILNKCEINFRNKCYINNEINNTRFNIWNNNQVFIINYPNKYLYITNDFGHTNFTIINNTNQDIVIIYDGPDNLYKFTVINSTKYEHHDSKNNNLEYDDSENDDSENDDSEIDDLENNDSENDDLKNDDSDNNKKINNNKIKDLQNKLQILENKYKELENKYKELENKKELLQNLENKYKELERIITK